MARRKLTPQQETALTELSAADLAWREAKATVEIEVKRIVSERLDAFKAERARRTIVATELGVPKSVAGKEGLHTKDPKAVEKVIAESLNVSEMIEASVELMPIRWIDRAAQIVGIHMPNYPTTSTDPSYPEVLEGTAQPDSSAPFGWKVLTDASDATSEFGTIPGFLRWELETVPAHEGDLREQLSAWTGAH